MHKNDWTILTAMFITTNTPNPHSSLAFLYVMEHPYFGNVLFSISSERKLSSRLFLYFFSSVLCQGRGVTSYCHVLLGGSGSLSLYLRWKYIPLSSPQQPSPFFLHSTNRIFFKVFNCSAS